MSERELSTLIKYLNTLDVWVVSSGGVGSNYIADFLQDNHYVVNTRRNANMGKASFCHGRVTHLCDKILKDKKCVYVVGDWGMAIRSQERRGLLNTNIKRVKAFHKGVIPKDDPYLYVKQYNEFKNAPNTCVIKYPFNIEQVKQALSSINLNCNYKSFKIKKRTTTSSDKTKLNKIIDIYDKNYKLIV